MRLLAALALALALPALALAADGERCTEAKGCTETGGTKAWLACDSQVNGAGNCTPFAFDGGTGAKTCTISVHHVQASCVLPAITCDEAQAVTGADVVWSTFGAFGTGTGPTGISPSQIDPRRPIGPAIRCTHANIASAPCTDVDVVIRCYY